MALGFCIQQSPNNNFLANLTRKQDEFANPQSLPKRLDVSSNKAITQSFVFLTKDFFITFMKAFIVSI